MSSSSTGKNAKIICYCRKSEFSNGCNQKCIKCKGLIVINSQEWKEVDVEFLQRNQNNGRSVFCRLSKLPSHTVEACQSEGNAKDDIIHPQQKASSPNCCEPNTVDTNGSFTDKSFENVPHSSLQFSKHVKNDTLALYEDIYIDKKYDTQDQDQIKPILSDKPFSYHVLHRERNKINTPLEDVAANASSKLNGKKIINGCKDKFFIVNEINANSKPDLLTKQISNLSGVDTHESIELNVFSQTEERNLPKDRIKPKINGIKHETLHFNKSESQNEFDGSRNKSTAEIDNNASEISSDKSFLKKPSFSENKVYKITLPKKSVFIETSTEATNHEKKHTTHSKLPHHFHDSRFISYAKEDPDISFDRKRAQLFTLLHSTKKEDLQFSNDELNQIGDANLLEDSTVSKLSEIQLEVKSNEESDVVSVEENGESKENESENLAPPPVLNDLSDQQYMVCPVFGNEVKIKNDDSLQKKEEHKTLEKYEMRRQHKIQGNFSMKMSPEVNNILKGTRNISVEALLLPQPVNMREIKEMIIKDHDFLKSLFGEPSETPYRQELTVLPSRAMSSTSMKKYLNRSTTGEMEGDIQGYIFHCPIRRVKSREIDMFVRPADFFDHPQAHNIKIAANEVQPVLMEIPSEEFYKNKRAGDKKPKKKARKTTSNNLSEEGSDTSVTKDENDMRLEKLRQMQKFKYRILVGDRHTIEEEIKVLKTQQTEAAPEKPPEVSEHDIFDSREQEWKKRLEAEERVRELIKEREEATKKQNMEEAERLKKEMEEAAKEDELERQKKEERKKLEAARKASSTSLGKRSLSYMKMKFKGGNFKFTGYVGEAAPKNLRVKNDAAAQTRKPRPGVSRPVPEHKDNAEDLNLKIKFK